MSSNRTRSSFGYSVSREQREAEIANLDREVEILDKLIELAGRDVTLPAPDGRWSRDVVTETAEVAAVYGLKAADVVALAYWEWEHGTFSCPEWAAQAAPKAYELALSQVDDLRGERHDLEIRGGNVADAIDAAPLYSLRARRRKTDRESTIFGVDALRHRRKQAVAERGRARRAIADGRAR